MPKFYHHIASVVISHCVQVPVSYFFSNFACCWKLDILSSRS